MKQEPYFLITGTYVVEESKHMGYGIGYRADKDILCFEDVTTNRNAIQHLIKQCNDLKLSPIHLADVIQDFIS